MAFGFPVKNEEKTVTKERSISAAEFDELCRFVCVQLKSSGSNDLNVDALSFAIYWQICRLFDQPLQTENAIASGAEGWQKKIQNLLDAQGTEKFDVSYIIDRHVDECITKMRKSNNEQFSSALS